MDCTNSNEERIEDDDAVVFHSGSKPVEVGWGIEGSIFGMGTVWFWRNFQPSGYQKSQAGFVINLPQVPEQTSIFVFKFVVETDDFFHHLKDSFCGISLNFKENPIW